MQNTPMKATAVREVRGVADAGVEVEVEAVKNPANPSVQKSDQRPARGVRCVTKMIWMMMTMIWQATTSNWQTSVIWMTKKNYHAAVKELVATLFAANALPAVDRAKVEDAVEEIVMRIPPNGLVANHLASLSQGVNRSRRGSRDQF